jgi:hypothetical protein
VQNLDEKKFEDYLKQFRPVLPEPIPTPYTADVRRTGRRNAGWVAVAAAVLLTGIVGLHYRTPVWVRSRSSTVTSSPSKTPAEPLTIRSAKVWLRAAPSFNEAVDQLAFRPGINSVQEGKQSAVAILSKEKIKL